MKKIFNWFLVNRDELEELRNFNGEYVKKKDLDNLYNLKDTLTKIESLLEKIDLFKELTDVTRDNVFLKEKLYLNTLAYNDACERADKYENVYFKLKSLMEVLLVVDNERDIK